MKINNKVVKKIKKDFPIFENNPGLIYLDNAATSQKPKQVIKSIIDFCEKDNANVGRGLYSLSERAMNKYNKARKIIAKFISANEKELLFTKNTTESINLLSYTIDSIIPKEKNEIVLTEIEHHSNLIPWQEMAKRLDFKLKFIKIKDDFTLDLKDAKEKITNKTAIVSLTHISNVTGTIIPIEKIIKIAKEKNALTIIDAAQSLPHTKLNVKKLDCDFLAFSGHKMLGPTGIGGLYGKKSVLNKLNPFLFGGGMISRVTLKNAEWAKIPKKFEAGTQNISEIIALAESIKYLEKIGLENISLWEKQLTKYALEKLKEIPGITIYNPGIEKSSGIISFNLKEIHPHDVAYLCDENKIAIRAGHCCVMPLMTKLGIPGGVCRASFYFYNTFEDVDKLIKSLKKIMGKFE